MTPADRCRIVAETCCQLLAADEPWRVAVASSAELVLVEVLASGATLGKLIGKGAAHAEAMRVLVKAAGRGEVRVRCWVYNTTGGRDAYEPGEGA